MSSANYFLRLRERWSTILRRISAWRIATQPRIATALPSINSFPSSRKNELDIALLHLAESPREAGFAFDTKKPAEAGSPDMVASLQGATTTS